MSFSIVYLCENGLTDTLKNTVKVHADIYKIPFFTVSSLETIGEFVKQNVKTEHVFLAKQNTYLNINTMTAFINTIKSVKIAGFHPNRYENLGKQFIDFDCGYLINSSLIHDFKYTKTEDQPLFDLYLLDYISTIPNLPINVVQGFNKLNFEANYQKTHICEMCEQGFKCTDVITLGNMSDNEMIKYHSFLEKERNGGHATIALAFMIKDEEEKVQETLDWYKNADFFPEIFILDTGSTDKTLEKVKEWSDRHPQTNVRVFELPFVDFSHNRNYILDKAYELSKCEYIISIDCNDEMKQQELCIKALGKFYHYPCIFITQVWKTSNADPIEFSNIRIVKNNGAYRWKYRVHEVLVNENVPDNKFIVLLPRETHLYQYRDDVYEKEKSARYKRDLGYFLEDYEKYPTDKRIVYYLSQTYFFNQDYENCIIYAKKRVELNKDGVKDEECYQSIFRIAKCKMLLKQPEYKIKKWLWYAWDYMKDIEPLLYIAQLTEKDDPKTAHHLYALSCEYPKPNFSLPLRHELYNFERYRKLAESYYNMKKYKETYETYKKILDENATPDQKQTITSLLESFYPSYHNPSGKPIVVIYGGYFYDRYWNGKMFYENEISLGGSESMVIKLAHLLAPIYNVYVFLNTDQDIFYKGVNYVKVEKYDHFLEINKAKHLILSRDSSKTHPNAEKTHLWLHDLTNVNALKSPKEYSSIVVLSKFHKSYFEEYLSKTTPNCKEYFGRIKIISNIVDISETQSRKKNQTHRFIYSSCPTRGLLKVLEDFPRIKEEFPDAELYLYCDFNNDYVRSRMDVTDVLMKIAFMKGVYNVGRLPERLFLEEVKKCNFWYYPTDFLETFCITAVQMMNNAVIPLYNPVGALPDVIQQAGIRIDKSKNEDVVTVLKNLKEKDVKRYTDLCWEQSKKYSDKNVKKLWLNLL
jgi:hypothetical protein